MKKASRTFWLKVHLYLGLVLSLPLAIVIVTGGIWALAPELQAWTTPATYSLEGEERLERTAVLDTIRTRNPDTHLIHVSMFPEEERPWIVYASRETASGSEGFQLVVDPTTASVTELHEGGWMEPVERLHRSLTMGTIGRYLVGASTVALVVLLLSGLYLWLPMWKGTIRRWIKKGSALGWHNVAGIVTLPLLLIMGITGLNITFSPYMMDGVYAVTSSPELPDDPELTPRDTTTISVARAAELARSAHPGSRLTAVQQGGPESAHKIFLGHPGEANQHGWLRVWVDPYSGDILQTLDTYEHSAGSIYQHTWWQFHSGEFFGFTGRLVWAMACFLFPLIAVTGIIRWWKKRPD